MTIVMVYQSLLACLCLANDDNVVMVYQSLCLADDDSDGVSVSVSMLMSCQL